MAKKKKRNNIITKKGNYYYRIRWYNEFGRQVECTVALNTKNKGKAKERGKVVAREIDDIKDSTLQRFQFEDYFAFKNDEGTSEYIQKTLQVAISDYLKYRKNMVRPSTAKRDEVALKQLTEYVGYTKPVEELSYKDIEGANGLIQHLRSKGCTDVGINCSLRHIRIFLNWMYDKEKMIRQPIKFKLIPEGVQLYHYFSENETNAVYDYIDVNQSGIDSFFKRCFNFYDQTGMRPTEPFIGELVGDWYLIPPELRKNKMPMQMQLNDELKSILWEMRAFRNSKLHCKDANVRVVDIFERTIMNIVRALGFTGKKLTLYSFRHAYAIRRITITGSIHDVMREMGHSNPQTTMRYLRFPEQRRLDDFPSLRAYIEERQNNVKSSISVTNNSVTKYPNVIKLNGSSSS